MTLPALPSLRATLTRGNSTDQGTFGRLRFGPNTCHTTELPWLGNLRKRSCIPPGEYACRLITSPKFGRCYWLQDVPGRSEVLIHAANFGGDVWAGWDTHLQGCIAPCERLGLIRNSKGRMQAAGLVSRPAVDRLMTWAAGRPFTLEIV